MVEYEVTLLVRTDETPGTLQQAIKYWTEDRAEFELVHVLHPRYVAETSRT